MAAVVEVLLGLLLASCVLSSPKYSALPNNQEDLKSRQKRHKPCDGKQNTEKQYYVEDEVILNLLHEAALGVDIFKLDPMETFNSGMREAIFSPTRRGDAGYVINNFVNIPRKSQHCQGHIEDDVGVLAISSFDEYLNESFSLIIDDTNSKMSNIHYLHLEKKLDIRYMKGTNRNKDQVAQFFAQTTGQIIMKYLLCSTHILSTNTKTQPVFNLAFLQAVKSLNNAAQQPESENSREIFKDFTLSFGTHYQSSTHFGTAVIHQKFYHTQPINKYNQKKRLKCAALAMASAIRVKSRTDEYFSKQFDQCKNTESELLTHDNFSLPSTRFVSLGSSIATSEMITKETNQSPAAIHYKLRSISSLFKESWFESLTNELSYIFDAPLNGTSIYEFLEYAMTHYYQNIFGAPSELNSKTCGYRNTCVNDTKCVDDSSERGYHCTLRVTDDKEGSVQHTSVNKTLVQLCSGDTPCDEGLVCFNEDDCGVSYCKKPCDIHNFCGPDHNCYEEPNSCKGYICVYSGPGRALITGGTNVVRLSTVETIPATDHFHSLPNPISRHSLAVTDNNFYSCGGTLHYGKVTADCYVFSRKRLNANWEVISNLPFQFSDHYAVTMGDNNIWYIVNDTLHIFDTTTEKYNATSLPFYDTDHKKHCVVSNGNYSYVIGTGETEDEIWVNSKPQDGTSWEKVANLREKRRGHACLWYDSNIMITGGINVRPADVEIFNTETNSFRNSAPMQNGRSLHAMMLYDGFPTVVAGWGVETFMSDLESFDLNTKQWFTQNISLSEPKALFSFAEVDPRVGFRGNGKC